MKHGMYEDYHPQVLGTMENLGQIYKSLGRLEEAVGLGNKAWQLREQYVGSKHIQTITAKVALAITLCDVGQAPKAIELLLEGIRDGKATLGAQHR